MQVALTEEQAEAVASICFWAHWQAARYRAMVASGVCPAEAQAWAKAEAAARARIAEEIGREAAATGRLAIVIGPDGDWLDLQIRQVQE